MRAIILAAGKGKRLVELTQHRPKCLIPVGGVPILSRFLEALEAVGIKDVVIVSPPSQYSNLCQPGLSAGKHPVPLGRTEIL